MPMPPGPMLFMATCRSRSAAGSNLPLSTLRPERDWRATEVSPHGSPAARLSSLKPKRRSDSTAGYGIGWYKVHRSPTDAYV